MKTWQEQLRKYSGEKRNKPKDWFEAFNQLEEFLDSKKNQSKIVVFIDELPWLDTPKSNFIRALELFWNSWASSRQGLTLVVCGSAATWMTNKLLGDKGGLHNRVTRPIHLAPFCLAETEEYLQSIGIEWDYHAMDKHAWSNMPDGKRNSWAGHAFEQVCILHVDQIKQALGISGIACDVCSWIYKNERQGAQIDLIIDRNDKSIDLCEIKYCVGQYELKKDYVEWMRDRRNLFREVTGTKKTLRLTMISSGGIKPGKYASSIQGKVALADLFHE